ncbi:MAG: fused MFS/spermidine synthase [Gemmataceae bacterium]|nr:fused MFS/spermidine synthase [Gemmataceae bacterium]
MPYLFAVTIFLSAALLFWVEPLVGKMVLPLLGGSPAVWNTCLVFFQAALLGGYLYAHASSTWLGTRAQAVLHLFLLGLALLILPIAFAGELPADSDPVLWLLAVLTTAVGLPFLVMAGSAPLLQKWFVATGDAGSGDPYFLYAASNLGSMLALLGYPFFLEPWFPLTEQSLLWTVGYGVLLLLTSACGIAAWRFARSRGEPGEPDATPGRPTWHRRLRWLMLSLVPSSLLLGVTAHVTTDIAAIPLLWVIPLALYLLSFILVFARKPPLPHRWMVCLLPVVALLVGLNLAVSPGLSSWQAIALHWLALFVTAMVFHGELAHDRPAPRDLTGFYLWIALGGAIGGLANVFVAPLAFHGRTLEYPLALVLACVLTPRLRSDSALLRCLDVLAPCSVGTLALVIAVSLRGTETAVGWLGLLVAFGMPAVAGVVLSERPLHFFVPLGAALLVVFMTSSGIAPTLYSERNFFGLLRVRDDDQRTFRLLSHGSTQHGQQQLAPDGELLRDGPPTGYYHRTGPIGAVFKRFQARTSGPDKLPRTIAVIGLGAGGLASYAQRGEQWTFYELDPAMERVARDPRLFTFLVDAERRGASVDVVLGDARLRLRNAPEHGFGLIIQDAFSSDSVPTHLISRQALQRYRTKRAPGGVLAFHVSNRYLDLRPVLADLARDANMVCYGWHDRINADAEPGKRESSWVVLADRVEDLGPLAQAPWQRLEGKPGRRVWEDDYSNLLQVFQFGPQP